MQVIHGVFYGILYVEIQQSRANFKLWIFCFSPGMCKIYKKKSNGSFRWDIDQACTLVPADIVACNSQFEPSPDPALEKIAEEATDK